MSPPSKILRVSLQVEMSSDKPVEVIPVKPVTISLERGRVLSLNVIRPSSVTYFAKETSKKVKPLDKFPIFIMFSSFIAKLQLLA
jgi:hypothetical protein